MQKYQDFLNQQVLIQTKSMKAYRLNDLKVWLKKSSTRHPWWIYLPLQWFSKLFQLDLLVPVPNHGGKDAILCEAKRLETLASIGINVPKVLAVSAKGLLIEDIASGNDKKLMQLDRALSDEPNFEKRSSLFLKTIHAIQDIHSKNQYLSEAFARNILVDSQQNIAFIDFETDPATVLDIDTCQTRDWLCLIFSTAFRFNDQERPYIEAMLKQQLEKSPKTLQDLNRIGKKFAWLNKIGIEKVGNDGIRMKDFLIFLNHL